MKPHITWLALPAAILLCALVLQGKESPKQSGPANELDPLRQRVGELESQVSQLEARLAELESRKSVFRFPQPPAQGRGSPSPEIWGEDGVNGWTFQIIPCAENSGHPGLDLPAQK